MYTTSQILTAIQARLLTLTATWGDPATEQTVYERVDFATSRNAGDAFTQALNFKRRSALIIPTRDRFSYEDTGRNLTATRVGRFHLCHFDKDYVPGQPAFFGSSTLPGVINIHEAAFLHFFGQPFSTLPQATVTIIGGEPVTYAKSVKDKTREGYIQELEITMGTVTKTLDRGRHRA